MIQLIEPKNEIDEDFVDFIKNYNKINRPKVLKLLNKYNDKNIFIFQNRNDADEFLYNVLNNIE